MRDSKFGAHCPITLGPKHDTLGERECSFLRKAMT